MDDKVIEIPLTLGKVALIDAADAPLVCAYKWTAMKIYRRKREMFYARRSVLRGGKMKTILLHRFILDAPAGLEVDHKNGDGFDCRRANMRLATRSQNRANGQQINSSTGYRGVCFDGRKKSKPFYANLTFEHKTYRLGYFETAAEGAAAYDAKAREICGEFASLNFPPDPTKEEVEQVEKEAAADFEAWCYLNEVV